MNKLIAACALAALTVASMPYIYALEGPANEQELEEFKKAEALGAADAKNDYAKGLYRIEVYGLKGTYVSKAEKYLERQYNIKTDAVAGCVVDSSVTGHAKGYNDTMKALLLKKFGKDVFREAEEIKFPSP